MTVMRKREALAMWVSKFPFLLLTKQEPSEKIIQRKINLGNQKSQWKWFSFKILETTHWLLTCSVLSSRPWMTGDLDPKSASRRRPAAFLPRGEDACLCLSLLIFCTSQRPLCLKPECPFTSGKASSAIELLLFFFFCTGLHWDNVKGDERGLNPRDISVSVWH